MYTHYLLTSMKVNTNTWKKYITQLQLFQFFMITLHQMQLFWVNDFLIWAAYFLVPQNIFMMILFWEFYYKTYIKKKQEIKTVSTKTESGVCTEALNQKAKILWNLNIMFCIWFFFSILVLLQMGIYKLWLFNELHNYLNRSR
jgi:hypothetical protein